jgi:hypothetical protein
MLRTLFGILALTLAAAIVRCAPADPKRLIVPGESIGVVRLGMNAPEVHAALESVKAVSLMSKDGKPAGFRDAKAGVVIEMWTLDSIGEDRYLTTMKVFFIGSRVVQIGVNSPLYATKKGASIRLSSADLKRLHTSISSMGTAETWSGKVRVYDSVRLGIGATYFLGPDGRERSGQEIFVHETGAPLRIESYRPKVETKPDEPAPPREPSQNAEPPAPEGEPMVPGPSPEAPGE